MITIVASTNHDEYIFNNGGDIHLISLQEGRDYTKVFRSTDKHRGYTIHTIELHNDSYLLIPLRVVIESNIDRTQFLLYSEYEIEQANLAIDKFKHSIDIYVDSKQYDLTAQCLYNYKDISQEVQTRQGRAHQAGAQTVQHTDIHTQQQ